MGMRGPGSKKKAPGSLEGLPDPPEKLGEAGLSKWNEIGAQLVGMRMMDPVDLHALEQLCLAYDQEADAMEEIEESGGYTVQGEKGPYLNPVFSALSNARSQIKHYISVLGMTRRTRIEVETSASATKPKVASRPRK